MKYDWLELEREFCCYRKYATCSLREFAKIKGIPLSENYRKHTKEWLEKRATKELQKGTKIEAKIEALEVSREVKLVERHLEIWDKFLGIVDMAISSGTALNAVRGNDSPYKAIKALSSVMSVTALGQRTALGLDKESKNSENQEDNEAISAVIARLKEHDVDGLD